MARCAVLGSGNTGTDLMVTLGRSATPQLVAVVGTDPALRTTVFAPLPEGPAAAAVLDPVSETAAAVAALVPGRLRSRPVIEQGPRSRPGGAVPARDVVLAERELAGRS